MPDIANAIQFLTMNMTVVEFDSVADKVQLVFTFQDTYSIDVLTSYDTAEMGHAHVYYKLD